MDRRNLLNIINELYKEINGENVEFDFANYSDADLYYTVVELAAKCASIASLKLKCLK